MLWLLQVGEVLPSVEDGEEGQEHQQVGGAMTSEAGAWWLCLHHSAADRWSWHGQQAVLEAVSDLLVLGTHLRFAPSPPRRDVFTHLWMGLYRRHPALLQVSEWSASHVHPSITPAQTMTYPHVIQSWGVARHSARPAQALTRLAVLSVGYVQPTLLPLFTGDGWPDAVDLACLAHQHGCVSLPPAPGRRHALQQPSGPMPLLSHFGSRRLGYPPASAGSACQPPPCASPSCPHVSCLGQCCHMPGCSEAALFSDLVGLFASQLAEDYHATKDIEQAYGGRTLVDPQQVGEGGRGAVGWVEAGDANERPLPIPLPDFLLPSSPASRPPACPPRLPMATVRLCPVPPPAARACSPRPAFVMRALGPLGQVGPPDLLPARTPDRRRAQSDGGAWISQGSSGAMSHEAIKIETVDEARPCAQPGGCVCMCCGSGVHVEQARGAGRGDQGALHHHHLPRAIQVNRHHKYSIVGR